MRVSGVVTSSRAGEKVLAFTARSSADDGPLPPVGPVSRPRHCYNCLKYLNEKII